MARTCLFCPDPARTREHVWSRWLAARFPVSVVETKFIEVVDGQARPQTRSEGKSSDVVVRSVCAGCNNGWMSSLESEAKEILEPMLDGSPQPLSSVDQLTIATWTTMKAMVFESMNRDTTVTTEEERHLLRTQRRPPANTRVRIAASSDPERLYTLRWFVFGTAPGGSPHSAYTLGLVVGKVILHVLGSPTTKWKPYRIVGMVEPHAFYLTPPSGDGVQWPPRESLDEDAFTKLIREPLVMLDPAGGPAAVPDP